MQNGLIFRQLPWGAWGHTGAGHQKQVGGPVLEGSKKHPVSTQDPGLLPSSGDPASGRRKGRLPPT